MLRALALASLLAGPPEDAAPPESARVEALAAALRDVRAPDVARLVASDPRFAALGPAERAALLQAVALDPLWAVPASGANLLVGFGIGSLLEGDRRGLWLTATDAVASALLLAAIIDLGATVEGRSSGAIALAPVAVLVLAAGRIVGVILPWTWHGRQHVALSRALRMLPPAPAERAALEVAPLVASAGGRLAPGATLALRF